MWNTPIGKTITLFNMPLFMFIVGYFSLSAFSRSLMENIQKKWRSLIRPMLPFCAILLTISLITPYALGHSYDTSLSVDALIYYGKLIYGVLFNSYWFIWAVVIFIIWTHLALCVLKKFPITICLIIALISFLILPQNPAYSFSTDKALYPFFLMGLLCRKTKSEKLIYTHICSSAIASLIVFICCYYAFDSHLVFYNFTSLSFIETVYGYGILLPAGISGIILSILVIRHISRFRNRLIDYLGVMGQYTFYIYMVQQVIVNVTGLFDLQIHAWYIHLLIAIVVFSIICMSVPLIRRSRLLSVALMGK